jgi:hypothetical protein
VQKLAALYHSKIKFALLTLALSASCSVYMEATRPTPVDLSQFQPGQNRDYVLEQLGAPQSTVPESDGASCDYYKLYTRGYGAGGKIPLALVESAADVFTLGLAEAVLTPTEGATKNELHPVTFCYKSNALVRVVHAGSPATESGVPEQTTQAQAQPSPTPSPSNPALSASPTLAPGPQTVRVQPTVTTNTPSSGPIAAAPSAAASPAQAAALQK